MFYMTLPFVAVMVGAAFYAARREPEPVRLGAFLLCGVPAGLLCAAPVTAGVFFALLVALIVWVGVRHRLRTFLPLAAVAVAIPYGLVGRHALKESATHDQLRQAHPLESLADRLPEPRADRRTLLSLPVVASVDRFEDAVGYEAELWSTRSWALQQLHERSVDTFVNSPGFGVGRSIRPYITEDTLNKGTERDPTPAQPGSPALWGSEPFTPLAERDALVTLHADGVLDFVNPNGWGYVQSRDRVAGFLPHRFSRVPEARTYAVQRVELVGLLKHPDPVVYLSDRLPAMADLQNVPTRALDAFETAGLERVCQGDDGFAARRGDAVRFVGGIRSAKQCV